MRQWLVAVACAIALVSGSRLGTAAEPKAFEGGRLGQIASELRAQITNGVKPAEGTLPTGLQQVGRLYAAGRTSEALALLRSVIARYPGASPAWTTLAELYSAEFDADIKHHAGGQGERIAIKTRLGARYNAFVFAEERVAEAAALRLLAIDLYTTAKANISFENLDGKTGYDDKGPQRVGELALIAIRRSVQLDPTAENKQALAALNKEYGFGLNGDPQIYAQTREPRACIAFTQPLSARMTDADRYVSVDPRRFLPANGGRANFAIDGGRLCIDGLLRNVEYTITFKSGLPAASGATLLEDTSVQLSFPGRKPSVRFVGRSYVVPRQGPDTIPILSNGLGEIELAAYRIGDRGLGPLIGNYCSQSDYYSGTEDEDEDEEKGCRTFPHPLGSSEYGRRNGASSPDLTSIIMASGQKVYPSPGRRGYVPVKRDADPDKDVRTSLALGSVIAERKPGLYLLLARSPLEQDNENEKTRGDEADWSNPAAQWLVITDIGLSSLQGPDGLTVLARSLASAAALPDVELRLVARNNEILATKRTGPDGMARFEAGLINGSRGDVPVAVVANKAGVDYSLLNLTQPAFDLTDRGIDGRDAPTVADPFMVTERGVYRPGETVNVLLLLRSVAGDALAQTPVTIKVWRPDDTEYATELPPREDQGAGGRAFKFALPRDAQRGTWRIECHLDPGLPPISSLEFLVDDYVAEKLDFDLKPEGEAAVPGQQLAAILEGRYLYGAPAADLGIEARIKIAAADTVKGAPPGFAFGLDDEEFQPIVHTIDGLPRTDQAGRARVAFAFPPVPATSKPLEATVTLGLREEGGRAVKRIFTLPIRSGAAMIGVKTQFTPGTAPENGEAAFDVIVVDGSGRLQAAPNLRWTLKEIRREFQWFREREGAQSTFRPFTTTRSVKSGTAAVTRNGPFTLRIPVGSGRFRLDLALDAKSDPITSISFDAGWFVGRPEENPQTIEVGLSKPSYAVGETAQIKINPRFTGRAVVAIYSDRVLTRAEVELTKGRPATVGLPVDTTWGPGAYALVFAYHPIEDAATRLRARAIGAVWVAVDPASRRLAPAIETPPETRPESTVRVTVRVPGLAAGEKAYAVLAAVDVGLTNLTRHPPPDPVGWLFAQRRLSAQLRDLYAYLVDGTSGDLARAQQGGDVQVLADDARPPSQVPLSILTPVTEVGSDGTATFELALPQFQGTVRLSAVVWSATRLGAQSTEIIVRDRVVLTAALPRFLAYGDVATLRLDLYNAELPAGDVTVEATFSGPIGMPAAALRRSLRLAERERKAFSLPVVALGSGTATLNFKVSAAGHTVTRTFTIPFIPAHPDTVTADTMRLGPGQSLTLSRDMLSSFAPGTGSLSLAASLLLAIDPVELGKAVPPLAGASTEMAVSRAIWLWMATQRSAHLHQPPNAAQIEELHVLINRICERQSPAGWFKNWPERSDEYQRELGFLDIYATDFLLRAAETGMHVDARVLERALRLLWEKSSDTSGATTQGKNSSPMPYALYVLARSRLYLAGHPGSRAANYWQGARTLLHDVDDKEIDSALDKAQIAAALALVDDRDRARRLFALATKEVAEPGSDNPDTAESALAASAGVLALAAAHGEATLSKAVAPQVARERAKRAVLSGAEVAWLAIAADVLARADSAISLNIGGQRVDGFSHHEFGTENLASPVVIRNESKDSVVLSVTKRGQSVRPVTVPDSDVTLSRRLLRPDGSVADPKAIHQHDRLVVVLEVKAAQVSTYKLIAPVPAGFEIESRPLGRASDIAEFPFLHDAVKPKWAEAGDVAYTALVEREKDDAGSRTDAPKDMNFMLGYVVRAITPGRFTLPEAVVTDVDDPTHSGVAASFEVEISRATP
jgi:uncharacterized protein YfaS (alpha-2-macroglobulin family)